MGGPSRANSHEAPGDAAHAAQEEVVLQSVATLCERHTVRQLHRAHVSLALLALL
jgi:hypothetical protein